MNIERRFVNEVAEKQFGFCQTVRYGNLLFVSGAVSWDDAFQPVHVGDMAGQIRKSYQNLQSALALYGLTFEHVLKETGFTTNMDATVAALGARAEFYSDDNLPASSWLGVTRLLHPDLMVEIELIAGLPVDT